MQIDSKDVHNQFCRISVTVVPNTGVPPVEVLALMFPDRDNSTLATMTLANYNASFNAVQLAIQQRVQNLIASAIAAGWNLI